MGFWKKLKEKIWDSSNIPILIFFVFLYFANRGSVLATFILNTVMLLGGLILLFAFYQISKAIYYTFLKK